MPCAYEPGQAPSSRADGHVSPTQCPLAPVPALGAPGCRGRCRGGHPELRPVAGTLGWPRAGWSHCSFSAQASEEHGGRPYLRLDPVEAAEPEDLAPAQLALGVVNLLLPLCQLLIGHLVLARPMARLLQALELAGGDGGNDLWEPPLRDSKQR